MNERINELLVEADIKFDRDINEIEVCVMLPSDLEKFAELIVQECMLQCVKVEDDDELSDYEGGFRDGALLCYQEIKKHFGVEE